eukprot:TRINITY_DN27739_c0_g1_i3.p1 TRINITY_DN27739_c0_g1~~TRINITY_DN27739_c0_g1_i3.p1  ORF type:complete len:1046 (+),score=209.17 TRINITY_DN27739_c0_g1_i3:233-3370(+)
MSGWASPLAQQASSAAGIEIEAAAPDSAAHRSRRPSAAGIQEEDEDSFDKGLGQRASFNRVSFDRETSGEAEEMHTTNKSELYMLLNGALKALRSECKEQPLKGHALSRFHQQAEDEALPLARDLSKEFELLTFARSCETTQAKFQHACKVLRGVQAFIETRSENVVKEASFTQFCETLSGEKLASACTGRTRKTSFIKKISKRRASVSDNKNDGPAPDHGQPHPRRPTRLASQTEEEQWLSRARTSELAPDIPDSDSSVHVDCSSPKEPVKHGKKAHHQGHHHGGGDPHHHQHQHSKRQSVQKKTSWSDDVHEWGGDHHGHRRHSAHKKTSHSHEVTAVHTEPHGGHGHGHHGHRRHSGRKTTQAHPASPDHSGHHRHAGRTKSQGRKAGSVEFLEDHLEEPPGVKRRASRNKTNHTRDDGHEDNHEHEGRKAGRLITRVRRLTHGSRVFKKRKKKTTGGLESSDLLQLDDDGGEALSDGSEEWQQDVESLASPDSIALALTALGSTMVESAKGYAGYDDELHRRASMVRASFSAARQTISENEEQGLMPSFALHRGKEAMRVVCAAAADVLKQVRVVEVLKENAAEKKAERARRASEDSSCDKPPPAAEVDTTTVLATPSDGESCISVAHSMASGVSGASQAVGPKSELYLLLNGALKTLEGPHADRVVTLQDKCYILELVLKALRSQCKEQPLKGHALKRFHHQAAEDALPTVKELSREFELLAWVPACETAKAKFQKACKVLRGVEMFIEKRPEATVKEASFTKFCEALCGHEVADRSTESTRRSSFMNKITKKAASFIRHASPSEDSGVSLLDSLVPVPLVEGPTPDPTPLGEVVSDNEEPAKAESPEERRSPADSPRQQASMLSIDVGSEETESDEEGTKALRAPLTPYSPRELASIAPWPELDEANEDQTNIKPRPLPSRLHQLLGRRRLQLNVSCLSRSHQEQVPNKYRDFTMDAGESLYNYGKDRVRLRTAAASRRIQPEALWRERWVELAGRGPPEDPSPPTSQKPSVNFPTLAKWTVLGPKASGRAALRPFTSG